MSAAYAVQVGAIARRSVTRTLRQPGVLLPPMIFPLALLSVNAAGLRPSTALPGFPGDSFLAFALAVPFIQGALFATLNAGADFARDAQTGFLNRLSLTALRGSALLGGQLAGIVVLALAQTAVYLLFGLATGVRPAAGAGGVAVIFAFAAVVAVGFGALGSFLALRTASGEAVQGMFPLFFVFLLVSSMNTPRHLIGVDWFRWAATANPVSYLIECIRSLVIDGWDGEAIALGFGVAAAVAAVTLTLAVLALRQRLTRT